MSPVKEPSYFASEVRPEYLSEPLRRHVRRQSAGLAKPYGWLACEWEDYTRFFEGVTTETAIGEASASYLWSRTAARNIHACIPDARIIMILRDPPERAFSQYMHQLAMGLTRASFREHLEKCRRAGGPELSIWHPFLDVGLYYEQVKRYLETFPREHIRIYWYETDWRHPAELLRDLFAFVGVDARFQPDTSRKSLVRRAPRFAGAQYLLKKYEMWQPLKALVPTKVRPHISALAFCSNALAMSPADREYLVDYYRNDIEKLATLLNRDLSAWLR